MRRNIRKYLILITVAVMALAGLSGCGGPEKNAKTSSNKLKIVTTIFPEYDWAREILGEKLENAELTMLLDNGVDLHSYQPTADDMIKIASCDLFIYVGGESDGWVEDALAEATNPDMQVINLMELLGDAVKEEELVEGMEASEHEHAHGEEEHEHGEEEHEHGEEAHEHAHGEEPEYDEHVWLSLRNAEIFVNTIAEKLSELDPANADEYMLNAESYINKLSELDSEYYEAAASASVKTILVGDRFPFRYLVDDYGIDYYAAFAGCSAETEASFETIVFLAGKADELGLHSILSIESSDGKIAKTIMENTKEKDQAILVLDSMQSTDSTDIAAGANYLSIMENNLEILRAALR